MPTSTNIVLHLQPHRAHRTTIDQNFVFLRGFSRELLCLLINCPDFARPTSRPTPARARHSVATAASCSSSSSSSREMPDISLSNHQNKIVAGKSGSSQGPSPVNRARRRGRGRFGCAALPLSHNATPLTNLHVTLFLNAHRPIQTCTISINPP